MTDDQNTTVIDQEDPAEQGRFGERDMPPGERARNGGAEEEEPDDDSGNCSER